MSKFLVISGHSLLPCKHGYHGPQETNPTSCRAPGNGGEEIVMEMEEGGREIVGNAKQMGGGGRLE